MKGASTSDWHLGYRAFAATVDGRNAREVDVERAVEAAVGHLIEADPDLVTICGDLFHHPRVGTAAEIFFREQVRRLREGTRAQIVVLGGNHDAVKTAGAASPVRIPEDYDRVHVVETPRRIRFTAASTGETVAVACFPYVALAPEGETYELAPDPDAEVNVLALHGAVKGGDGESSMPWFYAGDRALEVAREVDAWDAICVGDFHEFRRLHEGATAFYSGAVERTSSNIWEETAEKGVVVYYTRTGEVDLVGHETRTVRDFMLADVLGPVPDTVTVEHVNGALDDLTGRVEAGEIVRLVVEGFPREQRDAVDWQTVSELKKTCLHFQLDLRWSEERMHGFRDGRDGPNRTVADDARAFFAEEREEVRRLALRYLGAELEQSEAETEERPMVAAGGAS